MSGTASGTRKSQDRARYSTRRPADQAILFSGRGGNRSDRYLDDLDRRLPHPLTPFTRAVTISDALAAVAVSD